MTERVGWSTVLIILAWYFQVWHDRWSTSHSDYSLALEAWHQLMVVDEIVRRTERITKFIILFDKPLSYLQSQITPIRWIHWRSSFWFIPSSANCRFLTTACMAYTVVWIDIYLWPKASVLLWQTNVKLIDWIRLNPVNSVSRMQYQYWTGEGKHRYVSVLEFADASQKSSLGRKRAEALNVPYDSSKRESAVDPLIYSKFGLTSKYLPMLHSYRYSIHQLDCYSLNI